MSWWARYRFAEGLRRLGHRPRWGRDRDGFYAYCKDCVWAWGGPVAGTDVKTLLRGTDICPGRH